MTNLTITLRVKKDGFENIEELTKKISEFGNIFRDSALGDFSKKIGEVTKNIKDINKNVDSLEKKITKTFTKSAAQIKNSGIDSFNRSLETINKQADIFAARLVSVTSLTILAGLNIGALINENTSIAAIGLETIRKISLNLFNNLTAIFGKNINLFLSGIDKILFGMSGIKFSVLSVEASFKAMLSGVLSIGQSLVGSFLSMSAIKIFLGESTVLLQRIFGLGRQNLGVLARATRLIKIFDDSISNSFKVIGSIAKIGFFGSISAFINPILGLPGIINSIIDIVAVGIKKSRVKFFALLGSSQNKFILIFDQARELAFKTLPGILNVATPIAKIFEKLNVKDISNFFKSKLVESGIAKSEKQFSSTFKRVSKFFVSEIGLLSSFATGIAAKTTNVLSRGVLSAIGDTFSVAKGVSKSFSTAFISPIVLQTKLEISKTFDLFKELSGRAKIKVFGIFDGIKSRFPAIFGAINSIFSPIAKIGKSILSVFSRKQPENIAAKKENEELTKQRNTLAEIEKRKNSIQKFNAENIVKTSESIGTQLVRIEKSLVRIDNRLVSFKKTGTDGVVASVENVVSVVEKRVSSASIKLSSAIQKALDFSKVANPSGGFGEKNNVSRAVFNFFDSIERSLKGRNVRTSTFQNTITKLIEKILNIDNSLGENAKKKLQESLLKIISVPSKKDIEKALKPLMQTIEKEIASGKITSPNLGGKVSQILTQGIRGNIKDVEKAVSQIAEVIAAFFPQSPAKKGALTKLPQMGEKIVAQLAQGIEKAKPKAEKSTGIIAETIAKFFPRSPALLGALVFLPRMGFKIVEQLAGGIFAAARVVAAPVSLVSNAIFSGFSGITSSLFSFGSGIVKTIASGISSSISLISNAFGKIRKILSDEIEKNKNLFLLSSRIGIDAKEISLISNSFEVLGAQSGELDFVLARLNETINKTSAEDFKKFSQLGIDIKSVKESASPAIELLLSVSEVIEKFGINSREASEAINILGITTNSNLVSVLAQGRTQIANTIIDVKQLGGSVSNEIAKTSFNISAIQKKFSVFFESLKREFLSSFFEIIEKGDISKIISDNKVEITAFVKAVGQAIAALTKLVSEIIIFIIREPKKAFEIARESLFLLFSIVTERTKNVFVSLFGSIKQFFVSSSEFAFTFITEVAPKIFERITEIITIFFGEIRIFLAKNFPTITELVGVAVDSTVDIVVEGFKQLFFLLPRLGTKIIDTVFGEGTTKKISDKLSDSILTIAKNAGTLSRKVLGKELSQGLGIADKSAIENELKRLSPVGNKDVDASIFSEQEEEIKRIQSEIKKNTKSTSDEAKKIFNDLLGVFQNTSKKLSDNNFSKIISEGLEKTSEQIEKLKNSFSILPESPAEKEKIEAFKRANLEALDQIEKKLGTGITIAYRKLLESLSPENYQENLKELREEIDKTANSINGLGEINFNTQALQQNAQGLQKFMAEVRARVTGDISAQNEVELLQLREKHAQELAELENFLIGKSEQEKRIARENLESLQREEESNKIAELAVKSVTFYTEGISGVFGGISSTLEQISGIAKGKIKGLFFAAKAAAIAQATIDVASAFTRTLGQTGFFGIAQAGIATAAATAKLGQIIATTIGFAEGGFVNVGTTGTADDVMARLSKGEFVIPAKIVKSFGLNFFEGIRQNRITPQNLASNIAGSLPKMPKVEIPKGNSFAGGGLFTGQKQEKQKVEVNNVNFVDPSLFANFLRTKQGRDVFFNMLRDNPEESKRALSF